MSHTERRGHPVTLLLTWWPRQSDEILPERRACSLGDALPSVAQETWRGLCNDREVASFAVPTPVRNFHSDQTKAGQIADFPFVAHTSHSIRFLDAPHAKNIGCALLGGEGCCAGESGADGGACEAYYRAGARGSSIMRARRSHDSTALRRSLKALRGPAL